MGCCKCESQAQVCQGGETERHKHRNLTEEKDLLKNTISNTSGNALIAINIYVEGVKDIG